MKQDTSRLGFSGLKAWMKLRKASWRDLLKEVLTKPAYVVVLASNLAVFLLPGLDLKENAISFLWIYMMQSLMIGLVHIIKLNIYRFAPATRAGDWKNPRALSLFFLVHYGFFHFVYAFFIPPATVNWQVVIEGAAIFSLALIWNTIRHYKAENSGNYNANDFMFLPYLRIIPIHFAIILGGFLSAVTGGYTAVFVILAVMKTAMELGMEYFQHLGISFAELQKMKLTESHETG